MNSKSISLLSALVLLAAALAWLLASEPTGQDRSLGVEVSDVLGGTVEARTRLDAAGAAEEMSLSLGREALDAGELGVRVTGSGRLAGQVLERSTGAGVAGVEIKLYSFPPQGSDVLQRALRLGKTGAAFERRARPLASVVSEAGGRFRFEGVRAGTYFAEARGELYVPDPVVRVTLAPAGGEATLFVRAGGRIVGAVLRPDGRPAAGARVHVGHGEGVFVPALKSGDILLASTTADTRGRFEVGGLPPGPGFQVSVTDPELGIAFLGGLEVLAGKETRAELTFAAAAKVTGHVVSLRRDAEGNETRTPLEGAEVAAVPRGLREMQFADELMAAAHDRSDQSGAFEIGALPPGDVDLIAWAPGHIPSRLGPLPSLAGGTFGAGELVLVEGPVVHGRVVDEAGVPLEGVQVRWEMMDFERGFELTFAPLLYQAIEGFEFPRSDAEGRFVAGPFPGTPSFRLQLFKAGFAEGRARWNGVSDVELEVVMTRGGSVEGIVVDGVRKRPVTRFTIGGKSRVDTEEGAPGSRNPFGGGQLVEDARGRFRVPAVKPGKRSLRFSAEGYQSRVIEDLDIKAGEVLRGVIVQLDPGATLRGVVVDEAGHPVPGVRVAATRGGDFGSLRSPGKRRGKFRGRNVSPDEFAENIPMGALAFGVGLGLIESSLSDPAGRFELLGLGPGKWIVAGTHRDYSTGASEPVEIAFDEGSAAPVVEDVVVTMEVGTTLYGTVRDRRGAKQAGVMVIAFSPAEFASGQTAGGVYQAESDKEGDYRIANMVSGGYFLMVTRGDEHLDPFSFLGTMQFDLVTVPESGELRRDLVDQTAASTRVHGVVLEAGVPVSGGAVMALSLEAENMLGVDIKMAAVGREGAYEFPGLPEGLYQFRYEGHGDSVGREVEVPDLAETRIDLVLPDGALEGVVVDGESGAPVASAVVDVRRLDAPVKLEGLIGSMLGDRLGRERDWTGSDGAFEVSGLEAGRYEVQARGPSWGERADDFGPGEPVVVEIREGELAVRLELSLPPTHRIRGTVVDAGGAPVAGAWVFALSLERSAGPLKAKTNAEGRYELRGVGLGLYDLTVRADDFAVASAASVEVASDGAEVDFVLFEGVAVTVTVLDMAGRPLPGAVAHLVLEGKRALGSDPGEAIEGWFEGRGVADLGGRIALGRFGPGTYLLDAKRGKLKGSRGGIEVPEVGELELELRLESE